MTKTSFAQGLIGAVLACSGLLLTSLHAAPALAQSSAARPENPEVEKLVTLAIELRAQGKDLAALETLKKAAEIDPSSARVQVHLSNVHQALGQWLPADEYLRLALAQAHHPYVVRHLQALEDARKVIEDNIGTLEVDGEPAGAEVRLNGRLIGTLPLAAPVPVTVGSYILEVKRDGHYTASRPLVIAGHDFVRESVRLERLPTDELGTRTFPIALAPSSEPGAVLDRAPDRAWLTWTFAGLGVAAGVTTVGALIYREVHADHWNDSSRCLAVGQTREQLCGGERDKVESADRVALAAGIATGLFAAGALLNAYVFTEQPSSARAGLERCAVSLQEVSCFGSF
jgi:tetratricopeptide (TPR) repeat protein